MLKIFDIFKKRRKKPLAGWKDVEPILAPYKKTAWFPETEQRASAGHASRFSGLPLLLEGETWPSCRHCAKPMQLFLQLNSSDLPDQAGLPFGDGILQVFYCTNEYKDCEFECEAYLPFSQSTLLRVIRPEESGTVSAKKNPVKWAFPEKVIVKWTGKEDYPNWEELRMMGCSLSEDDIDILCDQQYPLAGDKLLGWPHWVQGVEYPQCPDCGKSMKLIFQIDSDDHLSHMFGDMGCAHITQCEDHRHQLAIAWACH